MLTRNSKHGSKKENDTAKSNGNLRNLYCNENNTDLKVSADLIVAATNGNVTFCEEHTTVLHPRRHYRTENGSSKSADGMRSVKNECVSNGNVKLSNPFRVQDDDDGDESWNIKSIRPFFSSGQTPMTLETTFQAFGSNPTIEIPLTDSNHSEFSDDQNEAAKNNNTSIDCNPTLNFIPIDSEYVITNVVNSISVSEDDILKIDCVLEEANSRSLHNRDLLIHNSDNDLSSHSHEFCESFIPEYLQNSEGRVEEKKENIIAECTAENCSEQLELLNESGRQVMNQIVDEYPVAVTGTTISISVAIDTPSQATMATIPFHSSFNTSTGNTESLTNGERVEYIQADSSVSDVFHEQSLDGTGNTSTYGLDTYASIPKASSGGRLRGSVELILEQGTESLGIENLSSVDVCCNPHNDVGFTSSSDEMLRLSLGDDGTHGDDTRETIHTDSTLLDNEDGEFQPPPLPVRNYTLSSAGDYEDDSVPLETSRDPDTDFQNTPKSTKEVWILKNKNSATNLCSDWMSGTRCTHTCCENASSPRDEDVGEMSCIISSEMGPSNTSHASLLSSPINPRLSASAVFISETPKMTTSSSSCQAPKYEFPKQTANEDIENMLQNESIISRDSGITNSRDDESPIISSSLESPTATIVHSTSPIIARTLPAIPKADHPITRTKSVNVQRVSSLRRRFSFTNPFERKSKRRPCNSACLQEDHNMIIDGSLAGNHSILRHSTLESAEIENPPSQESVVQFSPLPVVERRVDRVFRNPFARKDKHKSLDETSYAATKECQRPVSAAPRVSNHEDSHTRSATLDPRVMNSVQSPSTSLHSETLLEKFAVSCRSFKRRFGFMDNARRREMERSSMLESASTREMEAGSSSVIIERNGELCNSNVDTVSECVPAIESSLSPSEVRPPCVPPRATRNRCSANIVRPRSALTPNHSVRSSAGISNNLVGAEGIFTGAETSERTLTPAAVAGSSGGQNMEFIQSLCDLKECGWYWGPLGWEEAESKLADQADGTFLVRDSSDEHYILSLSFRSQGTTHHTRIEHYRGQFSFYSQPKSHGASTIVDFIDRAMEHSRNGKFLYFLRPRGAGHPPTPVQMLYPLSRFARVQSLQHSCRFAILKVVRRDHIAKLPLPGRIQEYLMEAQYYTEYGGTEE